MTSLTDLVPISSIANLNAGLRSAHSSTMIAVLGAPREPLDQHSCRNAQASAAVTQLLEMRQITPNFKLTGIKPALDSVQKVIANVTRERPDLAAALGTEGMICVRHKKPTNGAFSDDPSNHSWGTAVDFKLLGGVAPGATGTAVPRWVALLVPFFNAQGWYSGISFADAMHFEVADQTIRDWSRDGLLGPPPAPALVASTGSGNNSGTGIGGFFSRLFGAG